MVGREVLLRSRSTIRRAWEVRGCAWTRCGPKATAACRPCGGSAWRCGPGRSWASPASPATDSASWPRLIAGLRRTTRGQVTLDDHDITTWEPDRRLAHGLAYIPEERMRDGVIRELSVEENLILEDHGRPPFARGIFLELRPDRPARRSPGQRVRDQDAVALDARCATCPAAISRS